MSRHDDINEAGKFLGLSAGHFAALGATWHEVGHYGTKCVFLRETASKRASAYLAKSAREGIAETDLAKYIKIANEEVDRKIAAIIKQG